MVLMGQSSILRFSIAMFDYLRVQRRKFSILLTKKLGRGQRPHLQRAKKSGPGNPIDDWPILHDIKQTHMNVGYDEFES